jgi:hypothetical protein
MLRVWFKIGWLQWQRDFKRETAAKNEIAALRYAQRNRADIVYQKVMTP